MFCNPFHPPPPPQNPPQIQFHGDDYMAPLVLSSTCIVESGLDYFCCVDSCLSQSTSLLLFWLSITSASSHGSGHFSEISGHYKVMSVPSITPKLALMWITSQQTKCCEDC
jgi:hypothetical protein